MEQTNRPVIDIQMLKQILSTLRDNEMLTIDIEPESVPVTAEEETGYE